MINHIVSLEIPVQVISCDVETRFAISDLTYDRICHFIDGKGVRQFAVRRNGVLKFVSTVLVESGLSLYIAKLHD